MRTLEQAVQICLLAISLYSIIGSCLEDCQSLGCYQEAYHILFPQDNPPPRPGSLAELLNRALNAKQGSSKKLTLESCAKFCEDFDYYGVEHGDRCFCGNGLREGSAPTEAAFCNLPCSGNKGQICGGAAVLNLYQKTCPPGRPEACTSKTCTADAITLGSDPKLDLESINICPVLGVCTPISPFGRLGKIFNTDLNNADSAPITGCAFYYNDDCSESGRVYTTGDKNPKGFRATAVKCWGPEGEKPVEPCKPPCSAPPCTNLANFYSTAEYRGNPEVACSAYDECVNFEDGMVLNVRSLQLLASDGCILYETPNCPDQFGTRVDGDQQNLRNVITASSYKCFGKDGPQEYKDPCPPPDPHPECPCTDLVLFTGYPENNEPQRHLEACSYYNKCTNTPKHFSVFVGFVLQGADHCRVWPTQEGCPKDDEDSFIIDKGTPPFDRADICSYECYPPEGQEPPSCPPVSSTTTTTSSSTSTSSSSTSSDLQYSTVSSTITAGPECTDIPCLNLAVFTIYTIDEGSPYEDLEYCQACSQLNTCTPLPDAFQEPMDALGIKLQRSSGCILYAGADCTNPQLRFDRNGDHSMRGVPPLYSYLCFGQRGPPEHPMLPADCSSSTSSSTSSDEGISTSSSTTSSMDAVCTVTPCTNMAIFYDKFFWMPGGYCELCTYFDTCTPTDQLGSPRSVRLQGAAKCKVYYSDDCTGKNLDIDENMAIIFPGPELRSYFCVGPNGPQPHPPVTSCSSTVTSTTTTSSSSTSSDSGVSTSTSTTSTSSSTSSAPTCISTPCKDLAKLYSRDDFDGRSTELCGYLDICKQITPTKPKSIKLQYAASCKFFCSVDCNEDYVYHYLDHSDRHFDTDLPLMSYICYGEDGPMPPPEICSTTSSSSSSTTDSVTTTDEGSSTSTDSSTSCDTTTEESTTTCDSTTSTDTSTSCDSTTTEESTTCDSSTDSITTTDSGISTTTDCETTETDTVDTTTTVCDTSTTDSPTSSDSGITTETDTIDTTTTICTTDTDTDSNTSSDSGITTDTDTMTSYQTITSTITSCPPWDEDCEIGYVTTTVLYSTEGGYPGYSVVPAYPTEYPAVVGGGVDGGEGGENMGGGDGEGGDTTKITSDDPGDGVDRPDIVADPSTDPTATMGDGDGEGEGEDDPSGVEEGIAGATDGVDGSEPSLGSDGTRVTGGGETGGDSGPDNDVGAGAGTETGTGIVEASAGTLGYGLSASILIASLFAFGLIRL